MGEPHGVMEFSAKRMADFPKSAIGYIPEVKPQEETVDEVQK